MVLPNGLEFDFIVSICQIQLACSTLPIMQFPCDDVIPYSFEKRIRKALYQFEHATLRFIIIIINHKMLFKLTSSFCKSSSSSLHAKKYMRSLSQTALNYRPNNIRNLPLEQSMNDRVVQTFFDTSTSKIKVFQAQNRLQQVNHFSSPSHSFYEVQLPFSTNEQLRKKMVQFSDNRVRIGRILELMDYIAANVAYRYCSPDLQKDISLNQLPFIAVTASIDEIDFFHSIKADLDCKFSGYVSFVGKSSMEVQIKVHQNIEGTERLACSAKFVMAARNKESGKAYPVPPLNFSQEPQIFKIKNQLGEKRQILRKEESKKNLRISPPTYEESSIIHTLLLQVQKDLDQSKWVPINQTTQKTTLVMHLQDKNLSGKIFGGFILRLAYELGWLTVFKFLKGKFPKCTHIDDVQFLGSVEIGSSMQLQASVTYITPEIIHAVVNCHNVKPNGVSNMTNILRISFEYEPNQEVKKIFPETLKESNQYIESMRRVDKYLRQ